MGYGLHITRSAEEPITLSEWRNAVDSTDGVRFKADNIVTESPRRESILLEASEGSAEFFDPNLDRWLPAFQYRSGEIVFNAAEDFEEEGGIIRALSFDLARKLGAKIIGDDGEEYRQRSGQY